MNSPLNVRPVEVLHAIRWITDRVVQEGAIVGDVIDVGTGIDVVPGDENLGINVTFRVCEIFPLRRCWHYSFGWEHEPFVDEVRVSAFLINLRKLCPGGFIQIKYPLPGIDIFRQRDYRECQTLAV